MEQFSEPPASSSLIGGGGQEAVWCQILADVLGHEITVFRDTQFRAAQALASLAHQGLGFSPAPGWANDGTICRPREEYRSVYDSLYCRYRKLYPALRGV